MAMGKAARAEYSRGLKQSREQIKVLQEKWPAGFPIVPSKVRPLVTGTSKTIAESLGWSVPYTRGVLLVWKNRTAYCNAVLRYRERINLDGLVSGEEVDDRARCWRSSSLRGSPSRLWNGQPRSKQREQQRKQKPPPPR